MVGGSISTLGQKLRTWARGITLLKDVGDVCSPNGRFVKLHQYFVMNMYKYKRDWDPSNLGAYLRKHINWHWSK